MQAFLEQLRAVIETALDAEESFVVLDGPTDPAPAETLAVVVGVSWSERIPPITTTETDVGADSVDVVATVQCALSRREPSGTPIVEVRGRALGNVEAIRAAVQADQTVAGTTNIARLGGTTRIWQGSTPAGSWCDVAFEVNAAFYL